MAKVKDWMDEQFEEIAEVDTIDTSETPTAFEPDPIPEPIPEPEQPKIGVVVDCYRLNVRVNPRADAEVVCVIDKGSKVVIDEEKSTRSFYKVCTEVGVEGYCMKQFIDAQN